MKRIIFSFIVLLSVAGANAQSANFEKLSKIKGVDYTHVDKDMIERTAKQGKGLDVAGIVNLGDDAKEEFLNQFDDVKVFKCEDKGSIKKFKKTVQKLLQGKEWEPLIDTKGPDGEILKIYLSKKGERSTNVVLAVEDEEANLVVINGTFDMAKQLQGGMKFNVETNY